MKSYFPNRRILSLFTFALVGLAVAVFIWGLQYKLSLYDSPHSCSRQIPQAKLLSKDQQDASAESPLANPQRMDATKLHPVAADTCFLFSLLLTLAVLHPAVEKQREVDEAWHPHYFAGLHSFFRRPPPSLA